MPNRRGFSDEVKTKAAMSVIEGKRTAMEVAKDLDVTVSQVHTWIGAKVASDRNTIAAALGNAVIGASPDIVTDIKLRAGEAWLKEHGKQLGMQ